MQEVEDSKASKLLWTQEFMTDTITQVILSL